MIPALSTSTPPDGPARIRSAGLCIGCGSCVAHSGGIAEMTWDRYGQLKPVGPREWLRDGPAGFAGLCPFSPYAANEDQLAAELYPTAAHADVRIGRFDAAYVGHVATGGFREAGSSGGMVSWVAAELIRRGLVDGVAHVVPVDLGSDGRLFRYRLSRSELQVREAARSRYYPVDLADVLTEIRTVPGRYAVVGVPCFIKAVNLLRREDPLMRDRIVHTLGLFCGHMKSARMVESFAFQMGLEPDDVRAVEFRVKDPHRPANWYTAEVTTSDGTRRRRDWWHLVDGDWGSGFFQNSACDYCDDVVAETADISFGDAWVEPYSSDGRGTNVVIVRSPVVHDLLRDGMAEGRLDLRPVGPDFIAETQAAGLRHRREGLALRLALYPPEIRLRKRVAPSVEGMPARRRLIYRTRRGISRWSHRLFWAARLVGLPWAYVAWGRAAVALYQGLAYSRGPVGKFADRWSAMTGSGD